MKRARKAFIHHQFKATVICTYFLIATFLPLQASCVHCPWQIYFKGSLHHDPFSVLPTAELPPNKAQSWSFPMSPGESKAGKANQRLGFGGNRGGAHLKWWQKVGGKAERRSCAVFLEGPLWFITHSLQLDVHKHIHGIPIKGHCTGLEEKKCRHVSHT